MKNFKDDFFMLNKTLMNENFITILTIIKSFHYYVHRLFIFKLKYKTENKIKTSKQLTTLNRVQNIAALKHLFGSNCIKITDEF